MSKEVKAKVRITKGKYGYLKKRKLTLLLKALILLVGIIGLVVIGDITLKTRKNWLVIFAALTSIPFAMQAATLLSLLRYKERPYEEYESVVKLCGSGVFDCDLMIVNEKGRPMEIYYCYVHEEGIFCWTPDKDMDLNKAAEYIRNFLRLNQVDGYLQIYNQLSTYKKRLQALPASDRDSCDELLLRQEGVMRSISM